MKYSKLSDYKIKKGQQCFCADIGTTKTAEILNINRNTINRYFKIFREAIFEKQEAGLSLLFG